MGLITSLFLDKRTSDINDGWERGGSREYIAAFTPDCDEVYVKTHCGIVINTPHPSDSGSVVVGISVSQDNTDISTYVNPTGVADANDGAACYWWRIGIQFGPWNPLEHTATGNPVDQPIDISFDWQVFTQATDVAINPSTGDLVAVLTSSGVPYDPPLQRELLKGVMRVAWNSLTFNPYSLFQWGNYINSDTWNGFPPYSVKFSPPKLGQRLYSQFLGQNYYRLEAEFCFNPNNQGWNESVIDRAFIALDSSGKPYRIIDSRGQPYPQPSLLDGAGHVLTNPSSYVENVYQTYLSTSFATAFPNLTTLFS